MTDSNTPSDLDAILAELEAKFASTPQEPTPSTALLKNSNKKRSKWSVKPLMGVLVLFLLVTASAVGVYLNDQTQDVRQQANVEDTCHIIRNGNTSITLTNCEDKEDLIYYNGPSCPTTSTVVDSKEPVDGTYTPNPSAGGCQQISYNFTGIDNDGNLVFPGSICTCSTAATATNTVTPTTTSTSTPQPTNTLSPSPSATVTFTLTPSPTFTNSPTPASTLTATATTSPEPAAAVCLNISLSNLTAPSVDSPPRKGDQISLTCGQVENASRYEFRVRQPDNNFSNIEPSQANIRVSQAYLISQAGQHLFQCRICTGLDSNSCSQWE